MRFIGSKTNIVEKIDSVLKKHLDGTEKNFVDLFAGSNSVGNYFSSKYRIISNDIMYFSYVLARGTLGIKQSPSFSTLKDLGIDDPIKYFNSVDISKYHGDFVTREYSPSGKSKRMYFTESNAKRIDFCRNSIEKWKNNRIITNDEYFYLLASLIAAIPYISNTTGTYGAYLKKWDKRSFKPLYLESPLLNNFSEDNVQFNQDSTELISKIKNADVVYIDTPYNTRQYPSNYHVLEMIARWEKPKLKGITGQPNLDNEKSQFAVKKKAKKAMINLLNNVHGKHVIISYSTDGIISEDELSKIIKSFAANGIVEKNKFHYRKYKSKVHNEREVQEILYYYEPKNEKKNYQESLFDSIDLSKNLKTSEFEKQNHNHDHSERFSTNGFIKSPLNYVGGKYKLLPQILPHFPNNITTFIDLFSGGANIGINIKANKVIFNDINSKINDFFRYLQNNNTEEVIYQIKQYIKEYDLTKTNEEGFKKFRKHYNSNPNPIALYTLSSYSFNYQFRFNNKMEYNNTFGKNRSYFSKNMENNLIKFMYRLQNLDCEFTDKYFTKLNLDSLTKNSFVYADPPYFITTGSYNDGNRGFMDWTDKQEKELYDLLDRLNANEIRFALSNVFSHKGLKNEKLISWSEKYNVYHLNYTYKNSSYNTKRIDSDEVLITNY